MIVAEGWHAENVAADLWSATAEPDLTANFATGRAACHAGVKLGGWSRRDRC